MNNCYNDYGFSKAEREYLTVPDNEEPKSGRQEKYDDMEWIREVYHEYSKWC